MIYVYSNDEGINRKILNSTAKLKSYLITEFEQIRNNEVFQDALIAVLPFGDDAMFEKVVRNIDELLTV